MLNEIKNIFKDQGLWLFMLLVPLVYPLLYSWIYNNETTREVPVCVVDMSDSKSSRELTRRIDASPDIRIAFRRYNMKEAEELMKQQEIYGIIYIPNDFDTNLRRLEQTRVTLYCDMTFMLNFKSIYMNAYQIILDYNAVIQKQIAGNTTAKEDDILTSPIKVEEVQMFNTTGGYGNFLLPAVLILVLQQTMILALGMRNGTRRQKKLPREPLHHSQHVFSATFLIYALMSAYVLLAVPTFFGFTQHINFTNFLLLLIPMLFAMISFAMWLSTFFQKREDVILCVVFLSIILLFLVGMSWPESALPNVWKGFAWIFPSTPAARAYIRLNLMGSDLQLVYPYLVALLIQGLTYSTFYILTTICLTRGKGKKEIG